MSNGIKKLDMLLTEEVIIFGHLIVFKNFHLEFLVFMEILRKCSVHFPRKFNAYC